MSAEDRLNEKPSRRRGLRRQAEEVVNEIEDDVEDEVGDEEEEESSGRGITAGKGRPTPSRRTQELEVVKQEEGNILTRSTRGLREYLEGANTERQKIVWPTREETRRLTTIVLTVTIIASIVLGIISLIFNAVLDAGLKSPGLIFGGLLVVSLVVFAVYIRNSNRHTSSF